MKLSQRSFAMNTLYVITSSAVTALLFTAGRSIAIGRRLQTIDDLKSGFSRIEENMKRLEETMTKLVDRISRLEGKIEAIIPNKN
jgi:hypothetical protein